MTTIKWRKQRINKKFLKLLHEECPHGLTNEEAYKVYYYNCFKEANRVRNERALKQYKSTVGKDPWVTDSMMTMNVRNQLCVLAYHGILIRIQPGVYEWPAEHLPIGFVDSINTSVEEWRLVSEDIRETARDQSRYIKEDTGEYLSSWDIYQLIEEEIS